MNGTSIEIEKKSVVSRNVEADSKLAICSAHKYSMETISMLSLTRHVLSQSNKKWLYQLYYHCSHKVPRNSVHLERIPMGFSTALFRKIISD